MTRIQFSKDQLLLLYREDLPVPEGTSHNSTFFIDKPNSPKLLNHQTTPYYPNRRTNNRNPKPKANMPKVKNELDSQKIAPVKVIPKLNTANVSTPLAWHYIDPKGDVQGPFQSPKLREWWEKNLLPQNIQISTSSDKSTFLEINQYFPDMELSFTYNPILFPFMKTIEKSPNDSLQQVFSKYEESLTH